MIQTVIVPVPTTGLGVRVDVSNLVGPKTVVFSGRFQGIYDLLASQDETHFVPILQFDAGGVEGVKQTLPGAFKYVRLQAATPTTAPLAGVTCVVSGVAAVGENSFSVVATLAAGAAAGLTPIVDLAAVFTPDGPEEDICFLAEGGLSGLLTILGSGDGDNFSPVGSFRRDRVPEGSPSSVKLGALPSLDKVRYVRLSLEGQVTSDLVVTVGGRVPASSSGANPDVADWPLDEIAYFILDGDSGSDANTGIIVAPPGTEFTPAETSAVAIRTTDRLEEIIPKFGAGRGYVILAKPRADGACYDKATPGDGLGTIRRDLLTGYALQIVRGSDLTNSAEDRAQLAMRAVVGPLTIDTILNSRWIRCTTPTGVDPGEIGRYRIRVVHAGMNFYAPGQNNDTGSPDPRDITVWQNSWGPIAPGDQVYVEAPATRFYNFCEGTTGAIQPAASPPTGTIAMAGLELGYNGTGINGVVQLGAEVNGGAPSYTCIRTQSCVVNGSMGANYVFTDETGTTALYGGFGIDMAGGCTSAATVQYLGLDVSFLDISCTLKAVELNITRTWHLLSDLSGGSQGMALVTNYYDQLFLRPSNFALFSDGHWKPSADSQGLIVAPDPGNTASVQIESLEQTGGETAATPGIILQSGQYTVTFVLDGGWFLGTGVLVHTAYSGAEILVSWESLTWTGFAIEGGVQVICKLAGAGYPNDTLPCPRGVVMHVEGGEEETQYPVGLVVRASSAGSILPALADSASHAAVVGSLLTNTVQDGFAVVGFDGLMVLRQEDESPNPTSGDVLYLSDAEDGTVTKDPPDTALVLGRASPVGQNASSAGGYVPTAWSPGAGGTVAVQNLAQTYDAGSAASDQTLTIATARGGGVVFDASTASVTANGPALTVRQSGTYSTPLRADRALDSSDASVIEMRRSRGTLGAPTDLQAGDAIGDVTFTGRQGGVYDYAALVRSTCVTVSPNYSTNLEFHTRPPAAVVTKAAEILATSGGTEMRFYHTPKVVPAITATGSVGASDKNWLEGYFGTVFAATNVVVGGATVAGGADKTVLLPSTATLPSPQVGKVYVAAAPWTANGSAPYQAALALSAEADAWTSMVSTDFQVGIPFYYNGKNFLLLARDMSPG
jgi:hypothetical protein